MSSGSRVPARMRGASSSPSSDSSTWALAAPRAMFDIRSNRVPPSRGFASGSAGALLAGQPGAGARRRLDRLGLGHLVLGGHVDAVEQQLVALVLVRRLGHRHLGLGAAIIAASASW